MNTWAQAARADWTDEAKAAAAQCDHEGHAAIVDGRCVRCRWQRPETPRNNPPRPGSYPRYTAEQGCPRYTTEQGCPLHGETCAA